MADAGGVTLGTQHSMALEDTLARPVTPDLDEVRAELAAMLASVRADAGAMPDAKTLAYQRVVFPQMARWLPPGEREAACADFEREATRHGG